MLRSVLETWRDLLSLKQTPVRKPSANVCVNSLKEEEEERLVWTLLYDFKYSYLILIILKQIYMTLI